MGQNAVVKEIVSQGVVQVSLMGEMQCGESCMNCKICTARPTKETLALAADPIGTQPGQMVEVESNVGNPIAIALLIFLLPCVTLLAGYLVGQRIGLGVGACLGLSLFGLVLGVIPALAIDRRLRRRSEPEFTILNLKRG